jgi:signal transduction histidine kinase
MALEIDIADDAADAVVRADASAVEQVLFNLVDNAGKYAASADDRRIRLDASRNGKYAMVRISDHGPGIPPAEARKLFRPFSKSARDAANSAPGVGLGLALSRRLARQMRGDLKLESGNGSGASFVLTLPLA